MNADELNEEIRIEIELIENVLQELSSLKNELSARSPSVREKTAAAGFLAQFYNGIENILKRINKFHNIPIPEGDTWHLDLFKRFCAPSHHSLPELFDEVGRAGIRAIVVGASSVGQYAVMAREKTVQVYCSNIEAVVKAGGDVIQETATFPNLELIETDDDYVYFDARSETGVRYACPVQCYLELMTGDKRERETAEQVKEGILAELSVPRGS